MEETPDDWNAALQQQTDEQQSVDDAETQRYGEQVMSDFDNLVAKGNQQRMETRRMKDATLSAMILQARNNNGFVPTDVLEAASQNMGFPVAGGNFDKQGNFFLYTMQQDQNGQARMAPVAIASPEMQFKTLSRAKMGLDYQREIWGNMSRRFTPSQLEKAGLANPDAPKTVGSVTDKGGVFSQALSPKRRSSISAFGADGKGGFTQYESNEDTGYRLQSKDLGTRREPTEAERVAQIKADGDVAKMRALEQGRNDRAQLSADTKLAAAETRAGSGGRQGYTLEERLKIIEAEGDRQLKVAEARKNNNQEVQAIKTFASLLKDPTLRRKLNGLGDEEANKFLDTLSSLLPRAEEESKPSSEGATAQGDKAGGAKKLTREEAIKKLLATGKYKMADGKVVPK